MRWYTELSMVFIAPFPYLMLLASFQRWREGWCRELSSFFASESLECQRERLHSEEETQSYDRFDLERTNLRLVNWECEMSFANLLTRHGPHEGMRLNYRTHLSISHYGVRFTCDCAWVFSLHSCFLVFSFAFSCLFSGFLLLSLACFRLLSFSFFP